MQSSKLLNNQDKKKSEGLNGPSSRGKSSSSGEGLAIKNAA